MHWILTFILGMIAGAVSWHEFIMWWGRRVARKWLEENNRQDEKKEV